MLAITLGIGTHHSLATRAARRMEQQTGVPARVLAEPDFAPVRRAVHGLHPSWWKLWLPQVLQTTEPILYFDADIWAHRAWDPVALWHAYRRPLLIARDIDTDRTVPETREHGLPLLWYFNAGLWIADPTHPTLAAVFETAQSHAPQCGQWHEQTALNIALQRHHLDPGILPRRYNTLLWPHRDDYSPAGLRRRPEINLHFASIGEPQVIHDCWDCFEENA